MSQDHFLFGMYLIGWVVSARIIYSTGPDDSEGFTSLVMALAWPIFLVLAILVATYFALERVVLWKAKRGP